MCLSVPGPIAWVDETSRLLTGRVDVDGVPREVRLACVPEADVGDFVVVRLGFTVSVADATQARRTLAVRRALRDLLDGGRRTSPTARKDGVVR